MVFDYAPPAGKYPGRPNGPAFDTRNPVALWRKILNFRMFSRNRKVYGELLDLPDYLLDDIGLSRSDVMAARLRQSQHSLNRR
ncbi:DUF1127 domain-containing protein [Roseibium marinum]|uniref:Uncharacterized protein YjiS (DUF1127 family) n=1 Tax=Roseibium marinum TaxID=281252 RepID=A0A2S3UW31_9HYPH|nr:DUF1127 domain-containing protein [Roseibium marinum]POF31669.1 uncharacterized protein YjiS (DUF1127 family) [Roseibium marinum]